MPFLYSDDAVKEGFIKEFKRLENLIAIKFNERFSNDDFKKDKELKLEIQELERQRYLVIKTSKISGMSPTDWEEL